MADSKLSALAAGTPAPADLLYLVQGGVSKKTTVADLRNSGPLDLAGGAVTTSDPVIDAAQTWNAAGVTFTGIKFNFTDTASAAGSLLMDLQVGGSSKFGVSKTGRINLQPLQFGGSGSGALFSPSNATSGFGVGFECNIVVYGQGFYFGGGGTHYIGYGGFASAASNPIGWSSSTYVNNAVCDLLLYRDAANTLAQRNGVNAQTSRINGTYTDGSNYRRLTQTMSAGGVAEIKPEGAGTGASGNVLHISGLPTSNPGPGILWNDAGTVKVGT